MKGYKVTNPDRTCKGMLFEVGKSYKIDGKLKLCENGIHFCVKANQCFNYYAFDSNNHVYEIESGAETIGDPNDKMCTSEIFILREIEWSELLNIVNMGHSNTGHSNTGDSNTGDSNTGHRNTGHRNTGHRNTGDSNIGHSNTGHSNTGDSNTGHWNTTNKSNGVFCQIEPTIKIFDQDSKLTLSQFEKSDYFKALFSVSLEINKWSSIENKYIKIDWKEACAEWWNKLKVENKKIIQSIPNFDNKKFYQITGIKIKEKNK